MGAFISKDPARADGEESAYQYCGGDPVGRVDPSGLKSISRIVPHPQVGETCFAVATMVLVRQRTGAWPRNGYAGETEYWYGYRWPGPLGYQRSNLAYWGDSLWKRAFRRRYGLRIGSAKAMKWRNITREIDANRAILARGTVGSDGHAFVVSGYRTIGKKRQVEIVTWGLRRWADNYDDLVRPSVGSRVGGTGTRWVWQRSAWKIAKAAKK